jgi:beta-barrel assembly-enhancing protease
VGKIKIFQLLILVSILAGCSSGKKVSVLSDKSSIDADEARLWMRSEEEEDRLLRSGAHYENKELNTYVSSVARKLLPDDLGKYLKLKVYIIKSAYRNAWAYPNGVIVVSTGMIARMENEAQLAALLGHEITHITHRHSIQEFRNAQSSSSFYTSIGAVFGYILGISVDLVGPIGARAAISGYSRERETEADMEGIELLRVSGYDCTEAPHLFMILQEELNDEEVEEPVFYGSHPHLQDRIDNYNDYIKKMNFGTSTKLIVEKEMFLLKTRSVIYENVFIDIALGRMKPALFCADKYILLWPKDPKGYYAAAEVRRQLNREKNSEKIISFYNQAIRCDPKFSEAYGGLGFVLFSEGNYPEAKNFLRKYVLLSPRAPDREYAEECIRQCK